ncbi:MAG TPA: hypothetical protein VG796_23945 [Verrucomicrobiales bacterium]|nr:hypothetical protein [Verrucomicrobiales bacterium]
MAASGPWWFPRRTGGVLLSSLPQCRSGNRKAVHGERRQGHVWRGADAFYAPAAGDGCEPAALELVAAAAGALLRGFRRGVARVPGEGGGARKGHLSAEGLAGARAAGGAELVG